MTAIIQRLIPTDRLRGAILDGFYEGWQKRGGASDYFPVQQVWDRVLKRYKGKVDGPLAEGAFNGLLSQGFLVALQAPDGTIGARITDLGRSHREELAEGLRTNILAYLGAVTGTIALLWEVLSKLLLPAA
jgi:hypothetical protein